MLYFNSNLVATLGRSPPRRTMEGKAVALAGVLGEGNEAWRVVGRIGSGGGSIMNDNILYHALARLSRRSRAGHSAGSLPNV